MAESRDSRYKTQIQELRRRLNRKDRENEALDAEVESLRKALPKPPAESAVDPPTPTKPSTDPAGSVEALRAENQALKLKQAVAEAATDLKVAPKFYGDIAKLIEVDGDVDPAAIKKAVADHVKERAYYLDAEAPKKLAKGEGAERGDAAGGKTGPTVKRSQLLDPIWLVKNHKLAYEAARSGHILDDE